MPILSRAGMSGVAMIACVNPQIDDYDETISILGNASLASKIREFQDVGRVASQQIPNSNVTLPPPPAQVVSSSVGGSNKGGIKLEELKDFKDKNPGAGAVKRKRHDSTLVTTATTTAGGRMTRKNSVVTGVLKSSRETDSVEPIVQEEKVEAHDDEEDRGVESERKRLRVEVETLREENSQLIQASFTRESEIRAEVSQEMIKRSSHLLEQINHLRQKLSHYEMQQVDDVTKSCRKAHKKQMLVAQEKVVDDLQEAEDELERVKAEYDIKIFKLDAENKRLHQELATVKQKLAGYEIEAGPSRLKKVFSSVKKPIVSDQENVVEQENGNRFQRDNSATKSPLRVNSENNNCNNSSNNVVFLGELKKSPSRSPLSQLSSNNINVMGSNSPARGNSPIKGGPVVFATESNSSAPPNKSPLKDATDAPPAKTGVFRKLRSHFGRA